ncbi:MAG: sulfite exporter TauE/SafE family protein [Roseovarius sp.]|nr:sulfite exporter TauE/SafE family protein [Roseovarius sp.]MCY4207179.1 sulfite exporter TauE/SafE family protein [Roseovarius sp.]
MESSGLIGIEWHVFAVGMFAAVFAGVSKGGFGSGASFAGGSLMALLIPPGMALGIMLPILMVIDAATLRPYWRKWAWNDVRLLAIGSVPGVALGAALYSVVNADVIRFLIGAICLIFVLWQMGVRGGVVKMAERPLPRWCGAFTGSIAGFTSFVSHAGGPPVAIYLLSRGLGKTEYQASTVLLFAVVNVLKFTPYAFLGVFTLHTFWVAMSLAPFALLGAWLGVKAHRVIPERAFFALTHVMLTLTGLKLIWDALS